MPRNHHENGGDYDGDEIRAVEGTSLNLQEGHYFRDNLEPIQQRLRERDKAEDAAYYAANASAARQAALPPEGSFIPSDDRSWEANVALIKDPKNNLGFNSSRLFDGIVAAKAGIRGLSDPGSRDYAKYEGLRTNLAVLRNTLLSQGMDDARMKTIAGALGEAFASDRWGKRPFTRWLSSDVASVESVGAAEMYKYLLEAQDKPSPMQWLRNAINSFLSRLGVYIPDRTWQLEPLEVTPFSPRNLAAPSGYGMAEGPQPDFVERYLNSQRMGVQFSKA